MKFDTEYALKRAGLNRSDTDAAGIRRESTGEGPTNWVYIAPDGIPVTDEVTLQRCASLAVPPAWTDVWYCIDPRGHLQATGSDAKGRRQYRYHADWIAIKAAMKYDSLTVFATKLHLLRARVRTDMGELGTSMPRSTKAWEDLALQIDRSVACATIVRLMDDFHIRVGSDEYARKNDSYGLTTMRSGHVTMKDDESSEGDLDIVFDFPGKSGKRWCIKIEDDQLSTLIEASRYVGGLNENSDVFRYHEPGSKRNFDIKAEHINRYIHDATSTPFTAKDFRTWAATWKTADRLAQVLKHAVEGDSRSLARWLKRLHGAHLEVDAASALKRLVKKGPFEVGSVTARKRILLAVIDSVATDLGNTRSVCRGSYIHPTIQKDWLENRFDERWKATEGARFRGLRQPEARTLRYLQQAENLSLDEDQAR